MYYLCKRAAISGAGFEMKIDQELLRQIIADLGLDVPFSKGQKITVKNCWHFSTDGNAIDEMFLDDEDFIAGMNRIYVTVRGYRVVILAFCLMDTHIHFVLYGEFDECNRFIHDYVCRTSRHIALRHGEHNKLAKVPIHHQIVDDDFYLKVVICYSIKNAPVGGVSYMAWDYPWCSGPLYFRRPGLWSSPAWIGPEEPECTFADLSIEQQRSFLHTRSLPEDLTPMTGPLVFPGAYVAYELVERIYKTCKSFNYFFCITKEDDVEARGGKLSLLSIPMQEMRQHKNELCYELFGMKSIKTLSVQQRVRLARTLRARYNSSLKQIIRLCGLVYDEVKDQF